MDSRFTSILRPTVTYNQDFFIINHDSIDD